MVDASPTESGAELDPRTERALAALLALDPSDAADVRERSPARRRPRRQHGPVLDLGAPSFRSLGDDRSGDASDGSTSRGGTTD